MLQALVITLREGFEAFLIVAISLSYLRQSGRAQLISAVHWGIAVAIGVSALGGYLLYHAANQEWLEGPLAMIAAVSVAGNLAWHCYHALGRNGRTEGHSTPRGLIVSDGRRSGSPVPRQHRSWTV